MDGTVGGGGHAVALARQVGSSGRLIGLDRDPAMLALALESVQASRLPVTLVHAAYSEIRQVLDELGIGQVDGVLLDLGLSSDQLAWRDRGSVSRAMGRSTCGSTPRQPGPRPPTWSTRLPEAELAQLFFDLGEERFSRRISPSDRGSSSATRPIEHHRPARRPGAPERPEPAAGTGRSTRPPASSRRCGSPSTTSSASSRSRSRLVPAVLSPGGRAAVISFHSLEDRRVKWAFKTDPRLTVLTKKPVTATAQEAAVNPRARSAKLRVVERCPNPSSSSDRP